MYTHDVFRPGHNCWRVEWAGRVAFLIDGEAYFRAFHAAVGLAQRSILIVGWDIDSRTRLVRDALPDDVPVTLFDCLAAAVTRHPPAARLRPRLGLRHAVRAQSRMAADLQVELARAAPS
jgi:hypothetical protein